MNLKILQAAVESSLKQAESNSEISDIAELKAAKDWLERLELQQKITASWQALNNLDYSLQQLYKHAEQDSDDCLQFLLELNGKPLLLDFNPAAFSDLQRLLHRQIAINYADNIE